MPMPKPKVIQNTNKKKILLTQKVLLIIKNYTKNLNVKYATIVAIKKVILINI
jgi:hypothetical protein